MLHHADPTRTHNYKVKQSDLSGKEKGRDTQNMSETNKLQKHWLNMHTAENGCRNMQSIVESHTHCLPTHPATWWCYSVPCKKWLLELAHAQHATLVPDYGQNKNVLEASGQNKNALELPKCVREPPSHTFICTTGWSRQELEMGGHHFPMKFPPNKKTSYFLVN